MTARITKYFQENRFRVQKRLKKDPHLTREEIYKTLREEDSNKTAALEEALEQVLKKLRRKKKKKILNKVRTL